jgi:hypothetical protein
VLPEVIADDARRRSDEAVRRLREESARRVEQRGRMKAFSSWCALATLAGGISLAALNAHEARLQEQQALRAAAERDERIANACAERSAHVAAIWQDTLQKLATVKTDEERVRIRAEGVRKAQTIQAAAAGGCGSSTTTQPAWIPEPRSTAPTALVKHGRRSICGGDPIIGGL